MHAVGKIRDLFAGVGIDVKHEATNNAKGIEVTTRLLGELDEGLIFVNLVDTDQVYGHRKDVEGFRDALVEIDVALSGWLELLRADDLLVLTADHGVDPDAPHTDHTREYAPLLAVFEGNGGRRHDGPLADVGASTLKWLTGREAAELPGRGVRLGTDPEQARDRIPPCRRPVARQPAPVEFDPFSLACLEDPYPAYRVHARAGARVSV